MRTHTSFEPMRLRELPQAMGRWELGVRPAPEEMRLVEPGHVLSVLDAHSGLARASGVVEAPTRDALLSVLVDAMTQSASGQAACRPRQLAVETPALQQELESELKRCGIPVQVVPMLPLVDDFMSSMREHLAGQPPRSPIGALVMERPLAEVAARIASLEPWRYLPGELPLLIADEGCSDPPRVVVVMGVERSVEGVAAYDSEEQLEQAIGADRPMGAWCLLFHRAFEVPRGVRDEFIQLGLPVAHGLYPHFAMLRRAGIPDLVEQEEDAKRILAELEALEHYVRDCCQALADGQDPKRSGLELSNGRRVSITPRRDLMPDEPVGPDEDLEFADEIFEHQREELLREEEPDDDMLDELSKRLRGELGAVRGDPGNDVVASLEEDTLCAPPTAQELSAALGITLGLGDTAYRITLSTLPTESLKGARGARVALWQTEQRHGKLPAEQPAIILKMARRDAEDAARSLHRVNRACFRRLTVDGVEHELLVVSRSGHDETMLASWPLRPGQPPPSAWCGGGRTSGEALLLFVSGGAARTLRTLAPSAIVGGQRVDVQREPGAEKRRRTAGGKSRSANGNGAKRRNQRASSGRRSQRSNGGQQRKTAKKPRKKTNPGGNRRSKR